MILRDSEIDWNEVDEENGKLNSRDSELKHTERNEVDDEATVRRLYNTDNF